MIDVPVDRKEKDEPQCAFCRKSLSGVQRMIVGQSVFGNSIYICDNCVTNLAVQSTRMQGGSDE